MSAATREVALDETSAPPPPQRPGWLRRHGVAMAVAVVALAVAALVLQGRTDAAERRRVAALADVPGVLAPVGDDLRARWRTGVAAGAHVLGTPVDGVLVQGTDDDDGYVLQGRDTSTGRLLWTTPVEAPLAQHLLTWCVPVGAVAACQAVPDAPVDAVAVARRALWTVDPRTGAVLVERSLRSDAQVLALPGRLVVAEGGPGRTWTVRSLDPRTGDARWTYRTPQPGSPDATAPQVLDAGDGRTLFAYDGSGLVLDTRGVPGPSVQVTDVTWWSALRAGAVTARSYGPRGDLQGRILLRDGRVVRSGDEPLRIAVDDGSVPDELFTDDAAAGELVARSATDGTELWRARVAPTANLLLDGRLYVGTASAVVALDARTGDELWRRPVAGGVDEVSSDGRVLVVLHGTARADAFALAGGAPRWSTDLAAAAEVATGDVARTMFAAGRIFVRTHDDVAIALG
ncbi:PQQ-binding-like beta-propeller repeat protein [Cellulomonas sp. HZM]|uniref:outer membrane protein assembly factor BamB family protein n=1 Tax=Cellulomonas sp. HZM TaxID=1454010 RepID=UPI000492EBF6|nr:PQQ-binding-like beta-propeller repeat protein [Cellulomonas sp. HZM]